jgi:hypothetical protein
VNSQFRRRPIFGDNELLGGLATGGKDNAKRLCPALPNRFLRTYFLGQLSRLLPHSWLSTATLLNQEERQDLGKILN